MVLSSGNILKLDDVRNGDSALVLIAARGVVLGLVKDCAGSKFIAIGKGKLWRANNEEGYNS